jgi:hypothetical protein
LVKKKNLNLLIKILGSSFADEKDVVEMTYSNKDGKICVRFFDED